MFGMSRQRVAALAAKDGLTRLKPKRIRSCPCCGADYEGTALTCGDSVCKKVVKRSRAAERARLSNPNRRLAYEMRTRGSTWETISGELGYSHVAAAVRAARSWARDQELAWPVKSAARAATRAIS